LKRQPVDLGPLLRDSVDSITPAASAKSITIDVVDPGDLRPVFADADRMRQVVVNLLTNAVKFTPERGAIRLELRDGGSEQIIVVADDGAGMTGDQLPLVFERYYQATPDGRTGLGLGLSLVRDLVALHGGTVEAASAGPGHGSTFTVHLPVPQA
jgi:signal transduction histidine kinase